MPKFVLKDWQDRIIINALRASDGTNDPELIEMFIEKAKISREHAEAYMKSWRHNHQNPTGAIGVILCNIKELHSDKDPAITHPAIRKTERPRPVQIAEPAEGGKIAAILNLHRSGLSNKEIIAMGYNKSTVGIQVGKYKKRQKLVQ